MKDEQDYLKQLEEVNLKKSTLSGLNFKEDLASNKVNSDMLALNLKIKLSDYKNEMLKQKLLKTEYKIEVMEKHSSRSSSIHKGSKDEYLTARVNSSNSLTVAPPRSRKESKEYKKNTVVDQNITGSLHTSHHEMQEKAHEVEKEAQEYQREIEVLKTEYRKMKDLEQFLQKQVRTGQSSA